MTKSTATEEAHILCECGCGEIYPVHEMLLRSTDYNGKPFEWLSLRCWQEAYQGNDTHILWEGREAFYPILDTAEPSPIRVFIRHVLAQIDPLLKIF